MGRIKFDTALPFNSSLVLTDEQQIQEGWHPTNCTSRCRRAPGPSQSNSIQPEGINDNIYLRVRTGISLLRCDTFFDYENYNTHQTCTDQGW